MSITGLENIKTTADLRAERSQPVGGGDLDRNAFLRLFTTQLQNQNPLDPMKNEQFVAQLAQFSTLEATYSMSDSLGKFVDSQQSERMLRSSNLLGKQVFAPQVSMMQTGGDRLDGVVQVDQVFEQLELYVVNAETGQIVNQMEMAQRIQSLSQAVQIPIIADGDNGYGNALNVIRSVQAFEMEWRNLRWRTSSGGSLSVSSNWKDWRRNF